MKKYVLGFMFSPDKQFVVLIRKNRPEWQAGKWNGVGGKIELGEPPSLSMEREFFEETGVLCTDWEYFGFMGNENFEIYLYRVFSDLYKNTENKTDEKVGLMFSESLPESIISNLRFLIPAALLENVKNIKVTYR